jgi:hypothetical protein
VQTTNQPVSAFLPEDPQPAVATFKQSLRDWYARYKANRANQPPQTGTAPTLTRRLRRGVGPFVDLPGVPGAISMCSNHRKGFAMGLLLLILLILLLVGGLPNWGYARNWGYGPSGIVGLLLVVLVVLLLLDVVRFGTF